MAAGKIAIYDFRVQNAGNTADSFTLTVTPPTGSPIADTGMDVPTFSAVTSAAVIVRPRITRGSLISDPVPFNYGIKLLDLRVGRKGQMSL